MTNTTESPEIGAPVETLVDVSSPKDAARKSTSPSQQEMAAAHELVKAADNRGVALTGPGGLLKAVTKTILETALGRRRSARSSSST